MSQIEPIQNEGLAHLRRGLLALDDQRQALYEAGDYERLANGGADLKIIVDELAVLLRTVRLNVGELVVDAYEGKGRPKVEVPGLGVVEVPSGTERTGWESERLLRDLMLSVIVDPDTGELLSGSAAEIVDALLPVLRSCLPLTASLGWRIGKEADGSGLIGHGFDPDDYSERVEKPRLAVLPKRPVGQQEAEA